MSGRTSRSPTKCVVLHSPYASTQHPSADIAALQRIIDAIPLTIEHSLNQHLADPLQKSLVKNLDLGSPDAGKRLAELLAEDPAIAARRAELEAMLRRLEDVQRELEEFRNLNL